MGKTSLLYNFINFIIVANLANAYGDANDVASLVGDAFRNCNVTESGSCYADWDCNGDRICVNGACSGSSNC